MTNGIYTYLQWSTEEKEERGLVYTAKEIAQQPNVWQDTTDRITQGLAEWRGWMSNAGLYATNKPQVILSGAGSSYYVALCTQPLWRKTYGSRCEAWPTTRIIVEPTALLARNEPIILVSFARSGQNPESIGSVRLVDQIASDSHHIAITCNKESYLGRLQESNPDARSLVLHPDTLDKGLAMTSSFTSLVLAGLLLASIDNHEQARAIASNLTRLGERLLDNSGQLLDLVSRHNFARSFILGDGSQYGVALEGVLKLAEFTDGRMLGIANSFLAARHGEANAIDDDTLVVFLLASDSYLRAYQTEVLQELCTRRPKATRVAVTLHKDDSLGEYVDHLVVLDEDGEVFIPDEWRAPIDTLVLQCLALQRSLDLGIRPDQPFSHRATLKAVDGMKLIPFTEKERGR